MTTNEDNLMEECETGVSLREALDRRLLTIFDTAKLYNIQLNHLLEETYMLSEYVIQKKIDDIGYNQFYDYTKNKVQSYHAASVAMMMLYGILSCKENLGIETMLLNKHIERKFKQRPQMNYIMSFISQVKENKERDESYTIDLHRKDNINKSKNMANKDLDSLRGLFEGGNFPNAQINIVPGDGVQISYETPKKADEKISGSCSESGKRTIMEYVDRLKPLIKQEYQERYDEIWMGILELKEVREEVYDKGKQQDTTFNRNLVAQIFHMMAEKICAPTIKVAHMAERLEPDKGVDHPVRKKLAEAPKKGIKKSVENYLLENL